MCVCLCVFVCVCVCVVVVVVVAVVVVVVVAAAAAAVFGVVCLSVLMFLRGGGGVVKSQTKSWHKNFLVHHKT